MSEPIPSTPDHDQTELEKLLRASKPWFEKNATLLIYGLAAILALAAIIVFINRKPAGNEEATQELYDALLGGQGLRPEAFRDLADNYSGTPLEQWARLRQGEQLYADALNNLFSNREVGVERLDLARTTFTNLIDMSGVDDRIRQRAMIGVAKVTEAECDGSDESAQKAIEAWQLVLTSYEDSIMKDQIEARIEALESEDARQFYSWFQKQNPKPEEVPDIPAGDGDTGSPDVEKADPDEAEGDMSSDETPAAESETPVGGEDATKESAKPDAKTQGKEEASATEMKSETTEETPDAGGKTPAEEKPAEEVPPKKTDVKPTEEPATEPAQEEPSGSTEKPAQPDAPAEEPKTETPKTDDVPEKSDDPS